MSFEITTTRQFSASHQLRLYDGSLEPLHGHNWQVKVTVAADSLIRSASSWIFMSWSGWWIGCCADA